MAKYSIIGGDRRYAILFELLTKNGYSADIFANGFKKNTVENIEKATLADIIIAPVPIGGSLKTQSGEWSFDEFFRITEGKIMYCGGAGQNVRELAKSFNIDLRDFNDYDSFAVLNAVPTAEGAVKIAVGSSERTIFGSKTLVTGYGRCGKVLASTLKNLGATVYVACRKENDKVTARVNGFVPIDFGEGEGFDFVFNTVPAPVVDRKLLSKLNNGAVVVDIATGGGTDFKTAEKLDIKALLCPSLPGKTAPYTAAEIIFGVVRG